MKEDSLDFSKVFRAARYGRARGRYINCPMDREEYERFVEAVVAAERFPCGVSKRPTRISSKLSASRGACLARRKSTGLWATPSGRPDGPTHRPASLGGRATQAGQSRGQPVQPCWLSNELRWKEQERVFRLIPGLEHASSYASARCTAILSSTHQRFLEPTMQFRGDPLLFLAGQLVGMEDTWLRQQAGCSRTHAARY